MSFGELLSALLGWLGEAVEFLFRFVPRMRVIPWNERGVRYVRGREPTEVLPGIAWYWPWCTVIREHHTSRCVLPIAPISVETRDGVAVSIGAILVYHIRDVVVYDAENYEAEENLAEAATGLLRDAASSLTFKQLGAEAADGSRLALMLRKRMEQPLTRYGVAVESCRPNDLVRLAQAVRLFGIGPGMFPGGGIDHA